MKIKAVRWWAQDLGTKRPYTIAYKTVDEVVNAFVEIELANGITGIGCANPSKSVVNESAADMQEVWTQNPELHDFLVGRDIRHFESLLKEIHQQFAQTIGNRIAFDIALHDAFTQFLGIRLVDFYGQHHKALPTSITIGIKNVEETLLEAREYADLGFKVIKVKTGLHPEEDAERITKIQEHHPNVTLRVDANQGYTPKELSTFLDLSKSVTLDLIEQPFPVASFFKDIQGVEAAISELLVADESLRNPDDALNLTRDAPGCKIFNIKLMKCGGLAPARQLAIIASVGGVNLMWGCNDESAVSIAAALHLALSCPHTRYLDLDGSLDLVEDVVTGGFSIRDGMMYLPEAIGLGVAKC